MSLDLVVSKKITLPFDVENLIYEEDTCRLLSAGNTVRDVP